MKKQLAVLLCVIMVLALAACSGQNAESGGSATPSAVGSAEPEDASGQPEEPSEAPDEGPSGGRTLVVYFSATNHTETVAGYIADATGGDLFELVPVEPYTDADLDWTDQDSRVSREHDDESLRVVELENAVPDNWAAYDTVFIG